jgi:hypothetical protein
MGCSSYLDKCKKNTGWFGGLDKSNSALEWTTPFHKSYGALE